MLFSRNHGKLNKTVKERSEALELGNARLLGTERVGVRDGFLHAINEPDALAAMSRPSSIFGDGHASERIVDILLKSF